MILLLLLLLKLQELLLCHSLLNYFLTIIAPLTVSRTDLTLKIENEALLPSLDIFILRAALDELLRTANGYRFLQSLKLNLPCERIR